MTDRSEFVVVANRLPASVHRTGTGAEVWRRSPRGLVNALEPLLRKRSGTWVGWPGTSGTVTPPESLGRIRFSPVSLDEHAVASFYEGFSNSTLWPLYHDVVMPPAYRRSWWDSYVEVNRRFAEAAAEVSAPGATVWIHDYQLQLAPAMVRELRPDVRIGFFLHIPFPPVELFMRLPWRTEIVRGLLGADLIGFQRPGGAQNFLWLSRTLTGAAQVPKQVGAGPLGGAIDLGHRSVSVGSFPISVDAGTWDTLSRDPRVRDRAEQIRATLGNPRRVLLGVDRLDYTKGIDVRLHALGELLREGRLNARDTVMVQIAIPSRERVEHYRLMRRAVEREVGRLNGEFGAVGHPAVHYLHSSIDQRELAAFYRAADVAVVTPLRDGMNLVCKEYVASRHDLTGALVLSEFAGAAGELTDSFLVNPYHVEEVKQAIMQAVTLPEADTRSRMRRLRDHVLDHDIDHWATSFLDELATEHVKVAT
ncbi:alpha,alpha-trehalose-phosphate synthase (UDP-forming) [Amycolatopsis azurea]|uniref:Alpha,alpha-trehalose-phosphate synthase n=1 Tax=Amycolatopsis azurea DSM 43854 TaxID=1238180 RepID=M2QR30_9PSEU|nr:trehalose-6-phosphate synthase [Amycolatopsis azurea]EMD28272.1 Alpha,alpha-trehalose-phosphate synthase [Amycolatopsis azurea DSM 43854]OOC00785.1 trehalose-6-phosphate synthase [Amycolatopsis azurea DSM 43854]